MIRISNLKKSYNATKVLDDVSLNIGRNEVVSIIGYSGSGKTTLLNCIAGLDSYDSGTIATDIVKENGYGGIGMVFNSGNLFPHLTVLRNLVLAPVKVLGISPEQAEEEAMRKIYAIQSIIDSDKPYKRISDLPTLIQEIKDVYTALLDLKKSEVLAEIQAAMGEIHQNATRTEQKPIVAKADSALAEKREAAKSAETLTELDAMKIQISNIRSQYLRTLMIEDKPNTKTVSISRSAVCYTAKLESESDIDTYLARVKEKLMETLEDNDAVHII